MMDNLLWPQLAPSLRCSVIEQQGDINVEALKKELDFLYSNRDLHNQGMWTEKTECGTRACLAGWTVMHHGYEPQYISSISINIPVMWRDEDGNALTMGRVSIKAAEILGLNSEQATNMFYRARTLKELYYYANHYTDGAIEIPVEFQD